MRLHCKATILGYKRSRLNQHPNHALLRVEEVKTRDAAKYYIGKKVCYYYKTTKGIKGVWGKVVAPHGNSGVVKAKFKSNLTGTSFGKIARVFLYPCNI